MSATLDGKAHLPRTSTMHQRKILPFVIALIASFDVESTQLNAPGAKPQAAPSTFVSTTVKDRSTYTITYEPTTLTAATTVKQGDYTKTIDPGNILNAAIGAGVVAAGFPLLIPKPLPPSGPQVNVDGPQPPTGEEPNDGDNDDDDKSQCSKKTVSLCTENCRKTYFVSNCQIQTTSSCSKAACSKTIGCSAAPSTTTVLKEPKKHPVTTVNGEAPPPGITEQASPSERVKLQAYIMKEAQRLHLEYPRTNPEADVKCEKDGSRAEIEKKGIKVC